MKLMDLPYSDRHTLDRARQILERCEESEAKRFALTNEVKVSMTRIQQYSAYLQGARALLTRLLGDVRGHNLQLSGFNDRDGKVYDAAIVTLISSDLRHLDMYMSGDHEISFRNHQKDKKGRLTSVEAYFTHRITISVES